MQELIQELSNELILLILTLLVIQLSLMLFSVYDWYKQGESLDNRYIWLLLIIVGSILGPIIYFLAAPRENKDNYLEEN